MDMIGFRRIQVMLILQLLVQAAMALMIRRAMPLVKRGR
jgi:hypothetical protein